MNFQSAFTDELEKLGINPKEEMTSTPRGLWKQLDRVNRTRARSSRGEGEDAPKGRERTDIPTRKDLHSNLRAAAIPVLPRSVPSNLAHTTPDLPGGGAHDPVMIGPAFKAVGTRSPGLATYTGPSAHGPGGRASAKRSADRAMATATPHSATAGGRKGPKVTDLTENLARASAGWSQLATTPSRASAVLKQIKNPNPSRLPG